MEGVEYKELKYFWGHGLVGFLRTWISWVNLEERSLLLLLFLSLLLNHWIKVVNSIVFISYVCDSGESVKCFSEPPVSDVSVKTIPV